jgi:hypothetical protein
LSIVGVNLPKCSHEIDQPLGSILTNAETAQAILKSQSADIAERPDIVELKDIVNDILQDDRRATEVIRRMRSLLKKAPFELKTSTSMKSWKRDDQIFGAGHWPQIRNGQRD